MPTYIEKKCCQSEDLSKTYMTDRSCGVCILQSVEVQHVIGEVNVRLAWMRQRRYMGFTGEALAFHNMTNINYRHHTYKSYIDYMHGLLGRYNRKVIPACVVGMIRQIWPSSDGHYVGFTQVDEEGNMLAIDELGDI